MILGASARSAAQSAWRAGLGPAGIDLFADRDLIAVGSALRVDPLAYPEGLEPLAAQAPPGPWIYTGALENRPDLVDRIASARPLWGHPGPILRAVRDPFQVADVLRSAGMACPEVRGSVEVNARPRPGRWLVKPRASAGGRGIRPYRGETGLDRENYLQEWIAGEPLAALFVGEPGGARLLGITRQEIGAFRGEGRAPGFAYCGSIGPWPVSPIVHLRIETLGRILGAAFRLVGLFGVDLVLKEGVPYPVEVNPRYTASVEVLELALGQSLLADHVRVFAPDLVAPIAASRTRRPGVVGKALVLADRPVRAPDCPRWRPIRDPFAVPPIADIPVAGESFRAGQAVLTVFAQGEDVADCARRLARRAARWRERLKSWAAPGAETGNGP